ncbi:MAG: cytochrome c family protein [Chloroflexota bacterium]
MKVVYVRRWIARSESRPAETLSRGPRALALVAAGLLLFGSACIPPPPPPPAPRAQAVTAPPGAGPSPITEAHVPSTSPVGGIAASPVAVGSPVASAPSPPPVVSSSPAPSTSPGVVSGGLPTASFDSGSPERGQATFARAGCIGCHTANTPGGTIGPNLNGVATRAVERAALLGLSGPSEYFVQSIVTPQAYVVEGFAPVMLDWKQMRLTEQDLSDLAAFLGTLRSP